MPKAGAGQPASAFLFSIERAGNPTFAPMPRILAIDYGTKRTGLAVTDPLQIIAQSLTTLATDEVFDFLKSTLTKRRLN